MGTVNWSARLVTPPTVEPITLDEAKLHLRVSHTDEDALIAGWTAAAREEAERFQGRAYLTQTWRLVLDSWPPGRVIRLPRPPLARVVSIAYTDAVGVDHTLDPSLYVVDAYSEPGRIVLRDGALWPSDELAPAAGIRIEFEAGYVSQNEVPGTVKAAILLLVAHMYEFREPVVVGKTVSPLVLSAERLLGPDRVFYSGPWSPCE